MGFSAVMIFFDEYRKVSESLERLRQSNPDCQIILGSDRLTGFDSQLFNKFSVLKLSPRSCMQAFYDLTRFGQPTSSISLELRKTLLECNILRMEEAAKIASFDYILYLEPDVLVRGKLHTENLFEMDTLAVNKYSEEFIQLVNHFSLKKMPFDGWGFCTGFAKKDGFLEVASWAKQNGDMIEKLIALDYRMAYADFAFPVLFHLVGRDV
jgi:hypothetical protein